MLNRNTVVEVNVVSTLRVSYFVSLVTNNELERVLN